MSGKHQLAPNAKCLVCNDDASGFHYGVDSCEGCKGFFRRCITQGINFRCSNEEKCPITPFTRNSCQYCRLKKCFQVGMSREASRLGRRPKKILKGTKTVSGEIGSQSLGGTTPEAYDYPNLARATLTDMFGLPPEMMQNMSKNMPMMLQKMHNEMLNGDVAELARMGLSMPPGVMNIPPGMAMLPGMNMPGCMSMPGVPTNASTQGNTPSPNDNTVSSKEAPPSKTTEQVSVTDLNRWREKQFKVMSRYMHTKDPSNLSDSHDMDTQLKQECSAADGLCEKANQAIPSPPSVGSFSSVNTFGSADIQSDSINILTISEAQTRKLLKFKEYSEMEKNEETMDIISEVEQGIIGSHFEHCYHIRPRIAEAIACIDQREANGKNVKPPSGFWSHWMSELLPAIERVVRFLKDVPGFRELTLSDQIFSIKKGAFCILLSQAMPMVDSVKLRMLDPTLKYRNSRDDFEMMPPMFAKLFDDHFLLSREFLLSGITDEETGLMNAILGVNSSVDGFENKNAIMKLEQIFVQTLHTFITTKYPGEPDRFDRIIRLIPLVENASTSHTSSLHSLKTDALQTQAFPPLHREIYDLSCD